MPASISANFHEGTRSEYLAQYVFSAFGTAVPVPHPEDSGIDMHCTLGERVGQRFLVEDYFLVQVKSSVEPISYIGNEQVRWLLSHAYPFLICHVDKKANSVSIFQTLGLSFLHSKTEIYSIDLVPGESEARFELPKPDTQSVVRLGAPILRFQLHELNKPGKREKARAALRAWVRLDQENIDARKTGFTMWRYPESYKTNDPQVKALSFSGNFKDSENNPDVNRRYYDLLFKQLAQLVNNAAASGNEAQFFHVHNTVRSIMGANKIPDCSGVHIFAFCNNSAVKHLALDESFLISDLRRNPKNCSERAKSDL